MTTTKLTGTVIRSGSIPATALGGGVISSSVQLATTLPAGTISSSNQVDYNSITNKLSGVVSSSTQVQPLLPADTVSSSGQVDYNSITNKLSGVYSSSTQAVAAIAGQTIAPSIINATGAISGASVQASGNGTIGGSLTINQNLIVLGSSSVNYISQSTLNIGTNVITMNTNTPGTRLGGIEVIDSGSSPLRSGSLYFDSINDQWIFVHQNTAGGVTSSVVVMGPATFNSIGNETLLTQNRVLKGGGLEHISDSQITDNGITVSITNGLSAGTTITASAFTATTTSSLAAVYSSSAQTIAAIAGQTVAPAIINATGAISGASIQTSGNGTIGGNLTVATNALFVTSSGNVGIGTTIPSASLHVSGTIMIQGVIERANITGSAPPTTLNVDSVSGSVFYLSGSSANNWTVNFRGSAATSLNSIMYNGQSMTFAVLVNHGATGFTASAHQVDGVSITPRWQGGTLPSGSGTSTDIYSYTLIKTGNAAFNIFASQTKFA